MQTNKKLLVFVGQMGSGKDTCLDYLKEKYDASIFSFTDMLSEALQAFYLEFNRDNLIKMSECIRETYGEDTLAKSMAKRVNDRGKEISAIGNARRDADVQYLSQLPGYILIHIDADIKTRYERILKRGEKENDSTMTFEQFLEDHKRSTEISIANVAKSANVKIDNNGSLEELYNQIENIIKK